MAFESISLPRPVRGAEIMAAVEAVAKQNGEQFCRERDYRDGDMYRIGQGSGYPYRQVLVSSSEFEEWIRPNVTYDRLVVRSYQWPGVIFGLRYNEDSAIRTVRKFSEALVRRLFDVNQEPSVWPQEVTVCAFCDLIVEDISGRLRCPTHGYTSPTRKIHVVPVA